MRPAIYILTNWSNRVLYVGVTANLAARHWIHTQSLNPGSFSARYHTTKLAYYEPHSTMEAAIAREKQLKSGSRSAKIRLIERVNPTWGDLAADLYE
jgi:putative endonuclease